MDGGPRCRPPPVIRAATMTVHFAAKSCSGAVGQGGVERQTKNSGEKRHLDGLAVDDTDANAYDIPDRITF